MGRLTPEKVKEILNSYNELKSYSEVANKLGLDPKTVASHVQKARNINPVDSKNIQVSQDSNEEPLDKTQQRSAVYSTNFAGYVGRRERGNSMKQIVLDLDLSYAEAEKHESEYMKLNGFEDFEDLYKRLKANLDPASFDELMEAVITLEKAKLEIDKVRMEMQSEAKKLQETISQRKTEEEKISHAGATLQNLNIKIEKADEEFAMYWHNVCVLQKQEVERRRVIKQLDSLIEGKAAII